MRRERHPPVAAERGQLLVDLGRVPVALDRVRRSRSRRRRRSACARSPRARRPTRRSWRRRPRPRSGPRARAARARGSRRSSSSRGWRPASRARDRVAVQLGQAEDRLAAQLGRAVLARTSARRRRGRAAGSRPRGRRRAGPARAAPRPTGSRGAVRIGDERDVGASPQPLGVERLELERHAVARVEIVEPAAGVGARGDRLERRRADGARGAPPSARRRSRTRRPRSARHGSPPTATADADSAAGYSRSDPPVSRELLLDPLADRRRPPRR